MSSLEGSETFVAAEPLVSAEEFSMKAVLIAKQSFGSRCCQEGTVSCEELRVIISSVSVHFLIARTYVLFPGTLLRQYRILRSMVLLF